MKIQNKNRINKRNKNRYSEEPEQPVERVVDLSYVTMAGIGIQEGLGDEKAYLRYTGNAIIGTQITDRAYIQACIDIGNSESNSYADSIGYDGTLGVPMIDCLALYYDISPNGQIVLGNNLNASNQFQRSDDDTILGLTSDHGTSNSNHAGSAASDGSNTIGYYWGDDVFGIAAGYSAAGRGDNDIMAVQGGYLGETLCGALAVSKIGSSNYVGINAGYKLELGGIAWKFDFGIELEDDGTNDKTGWQFSVDAVLPNDNRVAFAYGTDANYEDNERYRTEISYAFGPYIANAYFNEMPVGTDDIIGYGLNYRNTGCSEMSISF